VLGQEPAPSWGPGRYAADLELELEALVRSGATPMRDRSSWPTTRPKHLPPAEIPISGLDWRTFEA
jgi:hypothetical protein